MSPRPQASAQADFLKNPRTLSPSDCLDEVLAGPQEPTPIPPAGLPIYLYGAGRLGKLILPVLRKYGHAPAVLLDANRSLQGTAIEGLPVLVPDEVPVAIRARTLVLVCVVTAPYEPIERSLKAAGFVHVWPLYDFIDTLQPPPMLNGWRWGDVSREDEAAIRDVYRGLADATSRAHYVQMLAWRIRRWEVGFPDAPVLLDDKYFPAGIVPLLAEENVLDAGAYDGTFLKIARRAMGERLQAYLGLEPDPDNFTVLEKFVRSWEGALAAQLLPCALAGRQGKRGFLANGMASRMLEQGEADFEADTLTLDDLTERFAATYVKLHLEGMELPVLRSGLRYLRRHRPVLVVTAYHNRDGLYALYHQLAGHLPDYRYHFRLHGFSGNSAYLYAVPVERG